MSILKNLKKWFGESRKSQERALVLRPPRVRVTTLHHILFHRLKDRSRNPISLGNISVKGMGLIRAGAPDARSGMRIKGELEINATGFVIDSEVRHESGSVLGCQFLGEFDALSQAVENYFRIEICALRLNRVDEAYLKSDPAGQVSWFTDGRQNEVYFVTDANGILSFHVSFLGNYIEGGRTVPLRCGHVVEDTEIRGHKGSTLSALDQSVSADILALGHMLIDNLEKIPDDQAKLLKTLLKK
jgi:hypothetical protein